MSEAGSAATAQERAVTVDRWGHVLLMGLNRHAFNLAMIDQLAAAYYELEADDELRCGVLFAHGEHFTGDLDLAEVGPAIQEGRLELGPERRDPWRREGWWTTPVVAAVHGWWLTLTIELLLAADIRIAADNARFAQLEIKRGLFPFGGGCARWVSACGWGNAMRYLLTGDELDARAAARLGLVQEVVAGGAAAALERALALATAIAAQAPLGVQATLASARLATAAGEETAARELLPKLQSLMGSDDAR